MIRTRLRPARPADAEALGAILAEWIDTTAWLPRVHPPGSEAGFAAGLIGGMEVTVALRWGRPVGFLARRGAEVHALYLAGRAQGQGVGARLMRAAQAAADELSLWCFEANAPARAFYQALGFAVVEHGDGSGNDEGLPDLRLVWRR